MVTNIDKSLLESTYCLSQCPLTFKDDKVILNGKAILLKCKECLNSNGLGD